ncbi:MAG: hypothetical protein ACM336_15155 [Acidobacteriota bacterium]
MSAGITVGAFEIRAAGNDRGQEEHLLYGKDRENVAVERLLTLLPDLHQVLALRWSDIVDGPAFITRSLSQTKENGLAFKPIKGHEDTEEPRVVKIPDEALIKLDAAVSARTSSTPSSAPTTVPTWIWSSRIRTAHRSNPTPSAQASRPCSSAGR